MAGLIAKACARVSRSNFFGQSKQHGQTLFGDAMWAFLAKVVMQFSQLGTFIIAARILTSAQFGLFSYVAALTTLLVVVAEGGWREFVMKAAHEDDRVDQIATVALSAGSGAMAIGLLVAAILFTQFEMQVEAWLVVVFSAWLLLTPFSSVCEGLLIAGSLLKALSLIRICAEICATAVAIYGLVHGWNIYALAAGKLASQLIGMAASLVVLKWLPALKFRMSFLRELFEFSKHITYNRALVLIRSYSGTLVVGSFLGLADAGYFRAAERIVSAFSDIVGEPARQIAWSMLRKIALSDGAESSQTKGVRDALGKRATQYLIVLMAVSAPVYVGLALMSGTLVDVVLGSGWAPAALLVTLLSLKQVLLVPGYITEPLLSLSGAIRKVPPAILINSLISVGLIVIFSPMGVVAVAAGQSIAAIFSFAVSGWLQARHGAVRWQTVLIGCVAIAMGAGAMAAGVCVMGQVGTHSIEAGLAYNILQVFVGCLIYAGAIALLYKILGGLMKTDTGNWGDSVEHVANRI